MVAEGRAGNGARWVGRRQSAYWSEKLGKSNSEIKPAETALFQREQLLNCNQRKSTCSQCSCGHPSKTKTKRVVHTPILWSKQIRVKMGPGQGDGWPQNNRDRPFVKQPFLLMVGGSECSQCLCDKMNGLSMMWIGSREPTPKALGFESTGSERQRQEGAANVLRYCSQKGDSDLELEMSMGRSSSVPFQNNTVMF